MSGLVEPRSSLCLAEHPDAQLLSLSAAPSKGHWKASDKGRTERWDQPQAVIMLLLAPNWSSDFVPLLMSSLRQIIKKFERPAVMVGLLSVSKPLPAPARVANAVLETGMADDSGFSQQLTGEVRITARPL